MNVQTPEMWQRWLSGMVPGSNPMDLMNGWWLRSFQNMASANHLSAMMPWAVPTGTGAKMFGGGMQQMWEPLFNMQQLALQFMGMDTVPKEKYEKLLAQAQELESKVKEQAHNIDRLRELLRETGGENNVVVTQLQDLIGQQSQQFKQFTRNVGDFIKSGTEKVPVSKD